MKRIYLTIAAAALCIGHITAQGQAWNNWNFGWFASMTFANGSPVETTGSAMISEEGCVSWSDEDGNLLFYTNGGGNPGNLPPGGVWNRNHQMMPNGNITNGAGCSSSPQSALVIPKTATQYYLYTMGCLQNATGLRQSIVDMTLDNGLGDLSQTGMQISSQSLCEGLTGTRHANGTDYWIVVHHVSSNEFYVYPHTAAGIGAPSTYAVGTNDDNHGQIKISASGNVITYGKEVFDFNNATGVISNPRTTGRSAWGRSFSPSGRYLYISGALGYGGIYQYDLQAPDLAASEVEIAAEGLFSGPMQLGPDGRIYVAIYSHNAVSAINSPESAGTGCNFVLDQVTLTNSCQLGLPNYMDSYYYELPLSIDEQQFSFGMFPNPATSNVTVTTTVQPDEIVISSVTGKTLQVVKPTALSSVFDVSQLSAGTYLITVSSQGLRGVKELVID